MSNLTSVTCDPCFDGRHVRCKKHGCSCTVCVTRKRTPRNPVPAQTPPTMPAGDGRRSGNPNGGPGTKPKYGPELVTLVKKLTESMSQREIANLLHLHSRYSVQSMLRRKK